MKTPEHRIVDTAQTQLYPLASDRQDLGYRLANALSYTVNPLISPAALFGIVLVYCGVPMPRVASAVLLVFFFFGLVPLGYIGWLIRRRQVGSVEVRFRQHRTRPFLVTIASSLAAALAVPFATPSVSTLTASLILCFALNTSLAALVNARWKISIHLLSIAGCLSILLYFAYPPLPLGVTPVILLGPPLLACIALLVIALMWARVRVHAHTPAQVTAGACVGLVLPYLELFFLYRSGILPGI